MMDERKRLEQEMRAKKKELRAYKKELGKINRRLVSVQLEEGVIHTVVGALDRQPSANLFPGRGPLKRRFEDVLSHEIEVTERYLRHPNRGDPSLRRIVDEARQSIGFWRRLVRQARTIRIEPSQVAQFYWREDGDIEDERFFFEEARIPFQPSWFSLGAGLPVLVPSWPKDVVEESLRGILVDFVDNDPDSDFYIQFITDETILEMTIVPSEFPNFTQRRCSEVRIAKDEPSEDFDFSDCPLLGGDGECVLPYGHVADYADGCPISAVRAPLLRMTVLLLAFINARNIELEYVDPFADKRGQARGGKKEWPDAWYEVRIDVSGLRTTSESTGTGPRPSYIFDVRGHFRRLTHERYRRDEDGYVRVIWIPAHLRGLASGGPYIPSVRRVIKKGV